MVSLPLRDVVPGDLIVECDMKGTLNGSSLLLYRIDSKGSRYQKQVKPVSKRVWLVTDLDQMKSLREDADPAPTDLRAMALGNDKLEGWMELRTLHHHFTHGIRL